MIRAVIFDLDELMVDSTESHYEAFKVALNRFGVEKPEVEMKVENKLMGMKVSDIAIFLIEKFKLDVNLDEFLEVRNKHFMKLIEIKTIPMPGLFKLIERLRGKYRLAICSSGLREYIDLIIHKLGLNGGLFEVIVSGDMVKKGKPDPEPYMLTAKMLHLPAKMCVVLEDAKNGVSSAKAAGCKCFGVKNPRHPIYKQDLSEADLVFKQLDEIQLEDIEKLDENGNGNGTKRLV